MRNSRVQEKINKTLDALHNAPADVVNYINLQTEVFWLLGYLEALEQYREAHEG